MVAFWILAALMTGVALAFVLVPLLRSRSSSAPSTGEAALAALRGQRSEIEADVEAGLLPADAREEALRELVARAERELPREASGAPARKTPASGRPILVAGAIALLLPATAVALYLLLGTPRGLDPVAARPEQPPFSDQQIVNMVETLAKKVRERPDDVQGWSLLARSMNALGRYPEAVDAYEHLAKLAPGNAEILADYADALAMKQGRNLTGRPYEIVKQALKIDPSQKKALALAGTAALNEGDFAGSIRHWQLLGAQLPPGSEDDAKVRSIIEEVRGRAAASGRALPAPRAIAAAPAAPEKAGAPAGPAASAGTTVSGTVSIAPELASKVAITDTLFIFARSEGGPRVPLAVLRGSAKELPKSFMLDDSMAMAPGMKLSTAGAVRIEARVSKSGNAMPQPGDLVGSSGVVKPGARDLKIVIDRTLP